MAWVIWIKEKLGLTNSAYYASEDSDSDLDESSSDSESDSNSEEPIPQNQSVKELNVEATKMPCDNKVPDLTTDAARRNATLPRADVITVDDVQSIEKELDSDEVISLVFLLYDSCLLALQEITLSLDGSNKKLLYEWAVYNQNKRDWQKKMVEALCIIKNYKVLKTFGYNKPDLVLHYLPHQANTVLHVDKTRKTLYMICEKLDAASTIQFIDLVRKDFLDRKFDHFKEYQPEHLELFLLYWETIGYIQKSDLSPLKRVFKNMGLHAQYNLLDEATPRTNASPKAQDAVQSNSDAENGGPSSSYEYNQNTLQTDNQRYQIDPQNPGLVMIINQEEFYTEFDAQYKHLLPPHTKEKLESRLGTKKDKQQLIAIFEKFGFNVIVEDNLTHLEMCSKIKQVVANVTNESSFFLCILSHGDKGVVYGCNSCKVKISHIQQLVSKSNLMGKPKVLILQSCQGRQCQILNESNSDDDEDFQDNMSLTTDGPLSGRKPLTRTTDLLLFWATVPGYAAIRDKQNGSWFIQTLCKKMAELQNTIHFADICTRTSREVTNKVWESEEEKKAMTPMVISTLRFDFFLPSIRK